MKSHICTNHPDTPGEWVEGTVSSCPYHGHSGRRQKPVRWGRIARAKMDRQAGVVGQDRGGYING